MRRLFRRDPDPFASTRYSGIVKSYKEREKKHMRHWWQWVALGLLIVFVVGGGYGVWLYYKTQGAIQESVGGVDPADEAEPFNVLLVGSDSREGLTEEEQVELGAQAVGGERADTVILAHIDPANDHVIMVQFPRDLWVPIPELGEDKINAALMGGPERLVETVKELTGLPINKYVQVNIAGFRDVVDAIGGVDICIAEAIPFDPNTGIEVTEDEVGMVHFDGDRAIRFVRSRNFETGDFARIQNQQKFVAAALNKVTSTSTLLNPGRIVELAEIAGKNLRTDQHTTLNGIKKLAETLRGFEPERFEAYIVPNHGIGNVNGISTVEYDPVAAEVMFEAIADNESPAEVDGVTNIEPSTVRVAVYNGTGVDGTASEAAADLEEATDVATGPVDIVEIADALKTGYKDTVITYEPEERKLAELVAAAIPNAQMESGKTGAGLDVEVTVGTRFETRQLVNIVPIPIPKPGDVPDVCKR
ncbi:MAG: LCP family protein [Actinobacteria bacterium]|nr:LCP family protein [Actinomycetota bacterium]